MCVHCGDVGLNKIEIKSSDQDQDQTKAKAKITRPRSRPKPDRAVLNHSQASARCIRQCDKLKQIKLCESDKHVSLSQHCLLYTSDAADDLLCVDLGGRRIIKNNSA